MCKECARSPGLACCRQSIAPGVHEPVVTAPVVGVVEMQGLTLEHRTFTSGTRVAVSHRLERCSARPLVCRAVAAGRGTSLCASHVDPDSVA